MDFVNAMKIAKSAQSQGSAMLQRVQAVLGEAVFEQESSLTRSAIRQAYHLIVRVLEDRDPNAPCHETDPWSAQTFSDLWKDDYGSRPRQNWNGRMVRDWIAERSINNFFEVLRDHAEDLAG